MSKPLVVIAEGGESRMGYNSSRDALSFVLRHYHGLDVEILNGWYLLEQDTDFIFRIQSEDSVGRVLAFLVGDKYHVDVGRIVQLLRKNFSPTIPIVFFKDGDDEVGVDGLNDPNLYCFYHDDQDLQSLIKDLSDCWHQQHLTVQNVSAKAEPTSSYLIELEKLWSMSITQKKELADDLIHRGDGVSRGEKTKGLAIHPVTMERQVSFGRGLHAFAIDVLTDRLETVVLSYPEVTELRSNDNGRMFLGEIIFGFIFEDVEGFSYPILFLYPEAPEEDVKKVVEFFVSESEYLPILSTECYGIGDQ